MAIKIVTDSTCDLPQHLLKESRIAIERHIWLGRLSQRNIG